MKILVTGGAGFIGTNLIRRLVEEGHDVVSVDNYFTGTKANHIKGAKYIDQDIRDLNNDSFGFWGVKSKPDIIFHLAAIARIFPSFKQPKEYYTTNTNGTLNLVDFCSKNNIPIVYAGSSSKHSGRFKNPYTFSKDVGEDIITLYQEHYNLKASIVRFYNVYGPNQLQEGGYCTVIGIWLRALREKKPLIIFGDGEQRRDFTHVRDIVDALVKIGDQNAWGHEFELGRGVNYSLNEIVQHLNEIPIYQPVRPGEARITLNTDITANKVLGWNPQINLLEYLTEEYSYGIKYFI
tara:strand:+ start:12172 stop:13050 length:879 start_codon:yes stop_codon:yes gene_type:complete